MMIFRFIFLAICFLLSVLQTSHARDFQRQRDIIEAEYRANVRFAQGDGFVAKHPEAAELCSKMFVGAVYALQGIEYAVAGVAAGPFGIAAKFAAQESAAFALETTIDATSSRAAKLITQCETLQQELQNTIKLCAYAGMCAGSVKASKKLVGSLSKNVAERVALLPSAKVQRHHIFPQKYRPFFEQLGINIDEHCVDLGVITHLRGVHGEGNHGMMPGRWNSRWKMFIEKYPKATAKDAYQFAGLLLDEFGLRHLDIKKYK